MACWPAVSGFPTTDDPLVEDRDHERCVRIVTTCFANGQGWQRTERFALARPRVGILAGSLQHWHPQPNCRTTRRTAATASPPRQAHGARWPLWR